MPNHLSDQPSWPAVVAAEAAYKTAIQASGRHSAAGKAAAQAMVDANNACMNEAGWPAHLRLRMVDLGYFL